MSGFSTSPAMVLLTPGGYPGADILVKLNGDVPTPSDGTARWRQIPRPRRRDALEFDSEDPLKINFGVMFENPGGQVEDLLGRMYGWAARGSLDEPTIVHVTGPIPYPTLDYVITKLDQQGLEVQRGDDGLRWRQEVKIELTEYQSPDLITQNASPAAAAQATADPTSSTPAASTPATTYTVVRGDTLSSIAARLLGSSNKWQSLANLNGVRDPKKLQVGQVLKLPS